MFDTTNSFISKMLDEYFQFLKIYDNLDYDHTNEKAKKDVNSEPVPTIETSLKTIAHEKFHIDYGFYTFFDEDSNTITHLYNQYPEVSKSSEITSSSVPFIPIPIFKDNKDIEFNDIFDTLKETETQSFWNLPDAYRANNWINGDCNFLHNFYNNTITQTLNKKSAYNIILSEEILFFLYGKYYLNKKKSISDIINFLKLNQNYATTAQITPNLKQLLKFACSVEAKIFTVYNDMALNNFFEIYIGNWNTVYEIKNRKSIDQSINKKLVEGKVEEFIEEISKFINTIVDKLITKVDCEIKKITSCNFKKHYYEIFHKNDNFNKSELWQKIARFNFEISEKLIDLKEDDEKQSPFHDILIFPILKSTTATFQSKDFFYKYCINDNKNVKIDIPFVMTCYITTLYGLDTSLLDEDEQSLQGFNITMEVCKNFAKPIVDEIFYRNLINARSKPAATRAAISQVMARNTSHNIGAHVMNKLIDKKYLEKIDVKNEKKEYNYQTANIKLEEDSKVIDNLSNYDADKFSQIAYFNNYLKCRMDYLADIAFGTPLMQTNRYAYSDLFLELDKVRLLLENISGLSDFKYKIDFKRNNEKLNETNDLLIAIPNDILGMQAFYNILENIIRNTAKHAQKKDIETIIFTVNFIDEVPKDNCNCDTRLNKEVTNILNDLIAVEVFDNIPIIGIGRDLTTEEMAEFKKIEANKTKFDDAIEELVFKQNCNLNADILEEGRKLRASSLGVIEMDASAAYLRKRDVSLINHQNYNVEHNTCWSCKSPNALDEKFEHGKVCRNFVKAFKKDLKKADDKILASLGYRFFLLRPEVVLVVTDEPIEQKNELKKVGIGIVNKQEFEKHLEDGKVYNHEFVLFDKNEESIQDLSNKHKTSLPLRIIELENNNTIQTVTTIVANDKKNWLQEFEKFCWTEWESIILKYKNIKKEQISISSSKNSRVANSIVLLDHLYNDEHNTIETQNCIANEKWKKNKDAFHLEALSSLAQARMPDFYDITKTKDSSQNEKFKVYVGNLYKTITEKKIIDAVLSKVIVLDERIQEAGEKKDFMDIKFKELYEKMNVIIPDSDVVNLGTNSFNSELIKKIEDYIINEIKNSKSNDFILIHYSILERMYKKEEINQKLFKILKGSPINIVITSGRGIPENLDKEMRFVNLSSVISAFVELRCKYVICSLLNSTRKIKIS